MKTRTNQRAKAGQTPIRDDSRIRGPQRRRTGPLWVAIGSCLLIVLMAGAGVGNASLGIAKPLDRAPDASPMHADGISSPTDPDPLDPLGPAIKSFTKLTADGIPATENTSNAPPVGDFAPPASVNLWRVDFLSGLQTNEPRGSSVTRVEFTSVPPSPTGYDLVSDSLGTIHWHFTPASSGLLVFQYVEIVQGLWGLSIGGPGFNQTPVLAWFPAPGWAPPPPTTSDIPASEMHLKTAPRPLPALVRHEVSYDGDAPRDTCPSGTWHNKYALYQESSDLLWTPIVISHSPYRGTGLAADGWSSGFSWQFGPFGYKSQQSGQTTLGTEWGQSAGAFRLTEWGLFMTRCDGEGVARWICGCTSYIVDDRVGDNDERIEADVDIWGLQRTTDADDWVQFRADGHLSTEFVAGYHHDDDIVDRRGTSSTRVIPVSQQTWTKVGGAVHIGAGWGPIRIPLSIELGSEQSSGTYYTYTFPPGYLWHIDLLGNGDTGARAFCYPIIELVDDDWVCNCNGDAHERNMS